MPMKHYLLILFLTLFFTSCTSNLKENTQGAWLGGEIINPNTPFVVLKKNNQTVDTILLDENNTFRYYIKKVEKGIYHLIHQEFQTLFIEPGDSLLLRLNTIEFDESLAFTGKGAERNNYLIKTFLNNERESLQMSPFYELEVGSFIEKLDSMKTQKLKELERFSNHYQPCDDFKSVAKATIIYDYYSKKELYPYAHFGRKKMTTNQLPPSYYEYLKKIEYNNSSLQSHYTYLRFLYNHFDHLAHSQYEAKYPYNKKSMVHTIHKMNAIDSLITIEDLKNNLLKYSIRYFLFNSINKEEEEKALSVYLNYTTDNFHKKEIKQLATTTFQVLPGNLLPNLQVYDIENNIVPLASLVNNKTTVCYFWSQKNVTHFKNIQSKAALYRSKYPNVNFIAFNTDAKSNTWKQIITRNDFEKKFEFRFENPKEAIEKLMLNTLTKAYIISDNGTIIDNNSNLFSLSFEEQLTNYLSEQ